MNVDDAERRRALDLAGRALSSRERTVAELRVLLERKRAEPGAIEAAIAELEAAGHLDDGRYAERFTDEKRTLGRWGRERIAQELLRRGVARPVVDHALEAHDAATELARARSLLAERFADGLHDDRQRDRAWQLLVRRGYGSELAYDAVHGYERGRR